MWTCKAHRMEARTSWCQDCADVGKAVYAAVAVFEKIRKLMAEEKNPPSMFGLAIWLARNLSEEESNDLEKYEQLVGEKAANRHLVSVLVATGKYRTEDDEFVEPA